ncbi:MAG: putative toxin-antitoxin system toxin component, PIN family [bacterium]|nr:putative toxin-antitoxin system toxin component, PIN family [bacterium]
MRIFVDSDVIISSFISQSGAAYFLLSTTSLQLFISSLSKKELETVVKRLGIESNMLTTLIENNLKVTMLLESLSKIKESFKQYVLDENDAHILAGARASKADFLITYNVKDFKIDKIKNDLGILTLTPGNFLQHLRSIK